MKGCGCKSDFDGMGQQKGPVSGPRHTRCGPQLPRRDSGRYGGRARTHGGTGRHDAITGVVSLGSV